MSRVLLSERFLLLLRLCILECHNNKLSCSPAKILQCRWTKGDTHSETGWLAISRSANLPLKMPQQLVNTVLFTYCSSGRLQVNFCGKNVYEFNACCALLVLSPSSVPFNTERTNKRLDGARRFASCNRIFNVSVVFRLRSVWLRPLICGHFLTETQEGPANCE